MRKKTAGFSLIELMIGLTVFTVVVLSVGSIQQRVGRMMMSSQLTSRASAFLEAEATRLESMSRLPERDSNDNLIYRNEFGDAVVSGGFLVPYGYNQYLTVSSLGGANGEVVTYPDVLSSQLNTDDSRDPIQLRRTFTVTTKNLKSADEYKEIVIKLSDPNGNRFDALTKVIQIKKPHSSALDTRTSRGTAEFSGRAVDKRTAAPVSPAGEILATLIPGDNTSQRYATADSSGRFYFAPPLNTEINYTLTLTHPTKYWPRTFPLALVPGSNLLSGDGNNTALLTPRIYADANVSVFNANTSQPIQNARVYVYHSGVVPNGRPSSYTDKMTDAAGNLSYRIELPQPDITYYNLYYINQIAATGFISIVDPSDRFLNLQETNAVNRVYNLYPIRYGTLRVEVRNEAGPLDKAYVEAFYSSNFTSPVSAGIATGSDGVATVNNIVINMTAAPTQTVRRIYFRVRAANHITYTGFADVTADGSVTAEAPLLNHRLYWHDSTTNISIEKGYTGTIFSKLWYEGHQGAGVNEAVRGPNPSTFLSESLTSGGAPAVFTWSGYDPAIINVSNTAYTDTKTILCLELGTTLINVNATYEFRWAGELKSLTKSRAYNVTCAPPQGNLTVTMSPLPLRVDPNSQITYTANPNKRPSDLVYTWTVSGSGAASVTYLNASNIVVANGSLDAVKCKVTAVSTEESPYTVSVQIASLVLGQSAVASHDTVVDYAALAVTLTPTGPINLQPGFASAVRANPTGGSGNYSYVWTMTNPSTGEVDSFIGSLSSYVAQVTNFTAQQVGSVNVNVKLIDNVTGEYREAASLVQVQPPGGITQ